MMSHESLKDVLAPVLGVLKDLGGKFVFTDDMGETFVITTKRELKKYQEKEQQQLPLPGPAALDKAVREHVPEGMQQDIMNQINRDLALAAADEGKPLFDDLAIQDGGVFKKVRFEPIKGDLPPSVQE